MPSVHVLSGHYELVSLLLAKNADPYLSTVQKNGISFGTSSSGNFNSFALAAANGHRYVQGCLTVALSHQCVTGASKCATNTLINTNL